MEEKVIKDYEAKIKTHGIGYGTDHIDEFVKYNDVKYKLSVRGLRNES